MKPPLGEQENHERHSAEKAHEFKSQHYQFLQLFPYKHTWALDVHFLFPDSKELIHKMHIINPEPSGGSKGRAEMCCWKAPCEQPFPPKPAQPADVPRDALQKEQI